MHDYFGYRLYESALVVVSFNDHLWGGVVARFEGGKVAVNIAGEGDHYFDPVDVCMSANSVAISKRRFNRESV